MAVPGDVGGGEDEKAASEVEQHAEIAPVNAIDEYPAEERNEKSRQGHDDHLAADLHRRVRGRHDVPTDAREVHPAAEERNEHGEKEKAEAALGPDQLPVHRMCCGSCHGAY